MHLEDLVDIEPFTRSITPPDQGMFQIWSATAHEISPLSDRAIVSLRQIYMEIPESELRPSQIITFIEALLRALPSDEDRKTLIRTEALQFRRFERHTS
jgi:hypothetical protein